MKKINIEGMMCMHCVAHVEKALKEVDGVGEVNVSLENNCAEISGNADDQAITKAVEEAGYKVTGIE